MRCIRKDVKGASFIFLFVIFHFFFGISPDFVGGKKQPFSRSRLFPLCLCFRIVLVIIIFFVIPQAIEVAELQDRIHLRTTYYNYAKHLESTGNIAAAILK